MDTNSRKYRLCVRWSPFLPNRDTRRVPSGLTISISKVYFNMDLSRPVQTFVHLKEGDNIPVGSECYIMSYIHEMAIEVHRDRGEEVAADQLGDGELLFELVAEARPRELKEEGEHSALCCYVYGCKNSNSNSGHFCGVSSSAKI